MAAQIDTPYLGTYLSVAEQSLQALLSAPTIELVDSLLRQVSAKAREHEQGRADQLKLEVELEHAVRSSESKARARNTEIAALRQKVADEQTSRANIESELQSLKTSASTSDHDASALKARIASLESTSRDTVQLLHSKSSAYEDASNDLVAKQQKINELRAEVSRLEQAAQAANSASTAAKLREQTNQQEIEMLRRNNDWLETELKTKSAEFTKFRKEKNSQLADLQRQNEDATMQIESQQRTKTSLQSRVEETTQKIDRLLVQIKDLREEADRNEGNFRAELDTAKRLEKLMEESLNTEKARRQDLDAQLRQLRDDAAEEVGRITAEVETEHQDRLSAEERVTALESQLEQLQSRDAGPPATPKNGTSGSQRGTPVPEATPSKRGITLTHMVSENRSLVAQLEEKERRVAELRSTIEEMLGDIEAREPEIAEMQADHARKEQEVLEMSSYVDKARAEREDARKKARHWEMQVTGLTREGEILRQQLRDLSSQVKILLMEVNLQSQGEAPFTAEQRAQLENLAHGDLDSDMAESVTDTSRYISQHLVAFRNIAELADRNAQLVRLTRDLGERMEGDEAQAKNAQAAQNVEELDELRQRHDRLKDEMSSLVTQSESYIKERDMFRRMLSHRGQLPPPSDVGSMFDESVNGQPPATPNAGGLQVPHTPNSKDIEDYRKLLKEMQSHFDSYRQESAFDRSTLKKQLTDTTNVSSELRSELSKKLGELTLANERYEMLQGNFKMLKAENVELQTRFTQMSEKAYKQDLRAQQVTEELVEVKAVNESIRNESANLKAEKEFWKSVENRLTNDNSSLQADRDRLNVLNVNMQNLLNEREHADAEGRRRLETQAENLEAEVKSLKRRLNDEQEENKRLGQRREHETSQTQTRTEELNSSLSAAREELVAAKTAKDHLQTRVDELVIELRSAQEKMEVLQQRPTTDFAGVGAVPQSADGSMSKEQELAMQVAELKKNLGLAQTELVKTREQIDKYKEISAGSEEELLSFTETHDQYRQETDKIIEEKESRIKMLERDLDSLREELAARNTELNEVRAENAQSDHKLEEQKAAYEAELTNLKDLKERAESAAQYHQQDLKTQAEIAQQAQQNYENELLKHAEAAKTLQQVRNEFHELKIKNLETTTSAETAEAKLAQNEESWTEAKDRYERELAEMRRRKDDIGAQNRILHEQLEHLNKQITGLQKSYPSADEGVNDENTTYANSEVANLQELIRYLRREKDIVDVQHDLASQEARRLRHQLEHTQSLLDETRLKLSQQRSAEETSELHALNHKKLMDTIAELNLNRESNSTLRVERQQLQSAFNEKSSQMEELQNQLSPLQAKISELEDQNEALSQELRMTGEARARFEQRYLALLNRSNSIDPADFEKLQQQVKAVEEERDTLKQSSSELQSQIDVMPGKIKDAIDEANKGFLETRQKIIEQSKNRDRTQSAKIKEKDGALQEAQQEKTKLEGQLTELQTQLDKARQEHEEQVKRIQEDSQTKLQAQAQQLVKQAEEAKKAGPKAQSNVNNAQAGSAAPPDVSQIQELHKKVQSAESQAAAANAKVNELESQAASTQRKLHEAEETVKQLQSDQAAAAQQAATDSGPADSQTTAEAVEQLRRELAETQKELEQKAADLLVKDAAASIQTDSEGPSVEEQIKSRVDEIQTELLRRHEERVGKAEESFKTKLEGMKQLLTKKLAEGKADVAKKAEDAHAAVISNLKAEHEAQIQTLNQRHQEEVEELRRLTTATGGGTSPRTDTQMSDGGAQTSEFLTQLGESEIRTILQQHEVARRMVVNSIKQRETKAEKAAADLWGQKLADAEAKARKDQEQAVTMEGKKFGVKLSMAENRAKAASAKIEVVQQAAKSTPEKAVGEVWELAKVAKPAPAQVPSLQQSIHASPATPKAQPSTTAQTPATSATENAKPASRGGDAASTTPSATPSKAASAVPNGTPGGPAQAAKPQAPATPAFAQSTHAPQPPAAAAPAAAPAAAAPAAAPAAAAADKAADGKPTALDQPLSDPKAGQAAPARGQTQSGIPVPGGRGSGIPQPSGQRGGAAGSRGRGARGGGAGGAGRGGAPAVNTAAAQGAAQAKQQSSSPRTMNPGAKQFVPKTRKRDADGAGLEGSVHAGESKRAKPESG